MLTRAIQLVKKKPASFVWNRRAMLAGCGGGIRTLAFVGMNHASCYCSTPRYGAEGRTRTDGLLITSELLCQLSYSSMVRVTGLEPVCLSAVDFESTASAYSAIPACATLQSGRLSPPAERDRVYTSSFTRSSIKMAVGVGFGPTVRRRAHNGFRNRRFQPLSHPAVMDNRHIAGSR